uniref:SCP domain-containing protein n=1 Tax=Leersia perrieri TaxID=77586 RepID=A0A0D9WV58_9ORYZ
MYPYLAPMASSSSRSILACLLLLASVLTVTTAQNSPQDFVTPHNTARANVSVGPVTWNDTVAAYAQAYANSRIGDCKLQHSNSGGLYGENLFWGSAGGNWTAASAVAAWVNEKQWYDHATNTCSAPSGYSCGHYTQVVWRSSTAIGCARVVCNGGLGVFITCNYSPPGNYRLTVEEWVLKKEWYNHVVWRNTTSIGCARVPCHPFYPNHVEEWYDYFFVISAVLLAATVSMAQNSPQDYVKARAAVGVGPVTWNETVADQAREYANVRRYNYCPMRQSKYVRRSDGKNIRVGDGLTGELAWVSMGQWYDHGSNTCEEGHFGCGDYTQVVWRNTTAIGCYETVKPIQWADYFLRVAKKGAIFAVTVVMAMVILATTAMAADFSDADKQQLVKLHNDARAAVGVTAKVTWSDTVAAKAQEHAATCSTEHIKGPYGENLWWGWSTAAGGCHERMGHRGEACTGGKECRHYTQVVWSRTTQIGCARVSTCSISGRTQTLIACNYNPPGNVEGQKPY